MKFFCIAAHPDDCLIFFYSFLLKHRSDCLCIIYLTYDAKHPRYLEVSKFWSTHGINTIGLGFNDSQNDLDNHTCTISFNEAFKKISDLASTHPPDYILTHNSVGEYAHPHHVLLNKVCTHLKVPIVSPSTVCKTRSYRVLRKQVDYTHFPIHRNAIRHFRDKFLGNDLFESYSLNNFSNQELLFFANRAEDTRLPDRNYITREYIPSIEGSLLYIGVNWSSLNYCILTPYPFFSLDINPDLAYLGSSLCHFTQNFKDHGSIYDNVCVHGLFGHPSYSFHTEINNKQKMTIHLIEAFNHLDKLVKPGGTLMIGFHTSINFDTQYFLEFIRHHIPIKYKTIDLISKLWTNLIWKGYKYR